MLQNNESVQALIKELDLHEWDLTDACADLIDPAELIEGLLASIEHERKPLIERLKSALNGKNLPTEESGNEHFNFICEVSPSIWNANGSTSLHHCLIHLSRLDTCT